ncbi:hypothetical protein KCMC57_up13960 [Kitasatospora sp. CMC57]|uniref:Uncharacterized protein n=1 Tax=Kitasatospora sp. CMC57 TaxID=3231513 RepID=A0AB33JP46_9ACTN
MSARREPVLLVPKLELPDAEGTPSVSAVHRTDWAGGQDPCTVLGPLLDAGRYGISDPPGLCTCSASKKLFLMPPSLRSPSHSGAGVEEAVDGADDPTPAVRGEGGIGGPRACLFGGKAEQLKRHQPR